MNLMRLKSSGVKPSILDRTRLERTPRDEVMPVKRKYLLLTLIPFSILFAALAVLLLRAYSAAQANGEIFTLASAPDRPVAIVFGAWVNPDGSPSPMLADRVEAAVKLYESGKVK